MWSRLCRLGSIFIYVNVLERHKCEQQLDSCGAKQPRGCNSGIVIKPWRELSAVGKPLHIQYSQYHALHRGVLLALACKICDERSFTLHCP